MTQFSNAGVEWLRQRTHSQFNTPKSPLISGKRPAEFLRRPQSPHHRRREYGRVHNSALTYESVSPQAIIAHRFPHSERAVQSRPRQYRMRAMRMPPTSPMSQSSATNWFRIERKARSRSRPNRQRFKRPQGYINVQSTSSPIIFLLPPRFQDEIPQSPYPYSPFFPSTSISPLTPTPIKPVLRARIAEYVYMYVCISLRALFQPQHTDTRA